MGNWDKINKMLDRELAIRERVILKRISALVSGRKTAKAASNGNGHTKPITTKRKQSAAVKNARQLHGSYLGLTRTLTASQKAQVKKTRQENGVRAAIKEAKALRASA